MKKHALLILLAIGTVAAQAPKPKTYVPPKTPWGDPNLQGLWPGSVNIPLQRPENMGDRDTLPSRK
jgi:hypothetical protein